MLAPPSGFVAGIYARTDVSRGVHKAPANETIRSIKGFELAISKREQDLLNPQNINVLRAFPGRGNRVWGARVLTSDSAWRYVSVRRLFLMIEESIDEATQWVVFEPNDEPLVGPDPAVRNRLPHLPVAHRGAPGSHRGGGVLRRAATARPCPRTTSTTVA